MAGYQRILSYLYAYPNGQRQQCIGFVKIEKREDSLRVNVTVNDERWQVDMPLHVSIYKDRGQKVSLQELGSLTMPKELEEMSLTLDEDIYLNFDSDLWDGVVIHDKSKIFYGSIWQGDELPLEKIIQGLDELKEEPIPAPTEMQEEEPEERTKPEEEMPLEEKPVELEATEVKQLARRSGTWRDYYDTRRKVYERGHQAGKEGISNW